MTASEFSQEFDILYNNIASNQAPGLTEYEKSVFLTKAQDEIIKNYFTGKPNGNKYQEGVEDSAKRYSDFSCLIKVDYIDAEDDVQTIDQRGKIIYLPDDLMITLNEAFYVHYKLMDSLSQDEPQLIRTIVKDTYQVVPITLGEYQRLMSKPSNDPLKRQVWKLMGNNASGNGSVEIIPHWMDVRYILTKKEVDSNYTLEGTYKLKIRYIRRPYPIIIQELSAQGLTINGKTAVYGSTLSSATEDACELSQELHPEILQRAVELAKVFYTGQPADVINAGQRSE